MYVFKKMPLARTVALMAILAGASASQIAIASEDALLQRLMERGVLTQQDVDELRAESQADQAATQQPTRSDGLQYEPQEGLQQDNANVQVRRFGVETADGSDRFRIRGRLMLDAAHLDDNLDTTDDHRVGEGNLGNTGTIIRRARLGALGLFHDNWEWQLEVDFRDEEVRFANAYIAYLMDNGRLAFGHFKEPFSLESSTSSRRISFLERATPIDAYRPSRNLGVMYETLQPDWYGAIGVFGGDGVGRDREVSEGYALSGRASIAPINEDNAFVHLGVSGNYRKNARNEDDEEYSDVRMRSRLGTRAIDGRIIGRRDMEAVSDYTTTNLEFAAGHGPFSVQAEYIRQDLSRDVNDPNFSTGEVDSMTMDGWYAQAGVFLTGESRNYRAFSGDFGRVTPHRPFNPSQGHWGAFELLGRYATADHTDHHAPRGKQQVDHWTLGLNWYLQPEIIAKFNVMYIDAEAGDESLDDGVKEWDSWVLGARLQYEF
ncbi:OprO/OprP family phosphate-selective porin [Franzmannia qiaohouensis]|uniref:Porin n=1 Tax=Franzmannia qiaohouensis TaxID=1329370 RepID=A0ABU1H9U1_9GAMM|nr:porin [Halomonas qiaohouensis]MDR5904062.1 porin [Halomonas qiaohouensis]